MSKLKQALCFHDYQWLPEPVLLDDVLPVLPVGSYTGVCDHCDKQIEHYSEAAENNFGGEDDGEGRTN